MILAALLLATAPQDALRLWDTVDAGADPASRDGWTAIGRGRTPEIAGDAVLGNGRLLAVFRKGGGIELYSDGATGPVARARLGIVPARGAADRIAVVDRARTAATVEMAWGDVSARFRLRRGDVFVEAQPGPGATALRISVPGRFVVLPDFFADDILIDARALPVDRAELPSENFVLHFTGGGDAIVLGVFENRDQDLRLELGGKGAERRVRGSEIEFGKGKKVWVSVLDGPGTWHAAEVGEKDAKKILPLDWTMPFPAQWRVDFTRDNGLADSWEMLLPEKDGNGYVKPSFLSDGGDLAAPTRTSSGEVDPDAYKAGGPASQRVGPERKKWITVLGRYLYPAWSDRSGKGFLQPIDQRGITFRGPVVLFPINRLATTPIDTYTVVDVVRQTLGSGPCQYILDVEGQGQEHVGRATCHVRTLLDAIYGAGEQAGKRDEIRTYLGDGLDFVTHIRDRIAAYVAFGRELRAFLAEQRKAGPEHAAFLDEMEALARQIDERVSDHEKNMARQPVLQTLEGETTREKVIQLNRRFEKELLGYEGKDWKERLKKEYTDPLTRIGGEQDTLVGECRWVVKAIRQKAGLLRAAAPAVAEIADEIRARCQKILRGATAYEGARH